MMTYRSNVVEEPGQVSHNPVNVLVLLNKAMTLAVCDLANDIKRIKLQPSSEIAALWVVHK